MPVGGIASRTRVRAEIDEKRRQRSLPPLPDHQVILVGSNPLPCYVAALALRPQRVTLVGTTDLAMANDGAESLLALLEGQLRRDGFTVQRALEILDASSARSIRASIAEIPGLADSGLSYTGGTKAMAVHAFAAWAGCGGSPSQASYLAADPPKIVFGAGEDDEVEISLRVAPEVEFSTLAKLHGLRPGSCDEPGGTGYRDTPRHAELASGLLSATQRRCAAGDGPIPLPNTCEMCKQRIDPVIWAKKSFQPVACPQCKTAGTPRKWKEKAARLPLDPVLADIWALLSPQPDPGSFSEFLALVGTKLDLSDSRALKYLEGMWIEDVVFSALQSIRDLCDLHSVFTEIKWCGPSRYDFEVDVCCVRGHTFFAFSCTQGDRHLAKLKLFEVAQRAQQLGGDHARYALVYPGTPGHAENLRRTIERNWHEPNHVGVFGGDDMFAADFPARLAKWIRTAHREEFV